MHIHFIFEPDSPQRFRDLGLLAEQLGFDAVWAPNILSARDPFLAFSMLARDSHAVRMGPVAISPFELHPLKMANALLTLNELSGGRANLVIGGGGGTMIGMGLKPDRRATHPQMVRGVRECVAFLRAASPTTPLNFNGELFQVQNYLPDWATAPAPRLYVAANRPQMLKLAAELADGVMLSDISLHYIGNTIATLRDGLATARRPADSLRINNLLAWHVKPDRAAAYVEARRKLWVRGIWERARNAPFIDAAACDVVEKNLPGLVLAYQHGEDPASVVPRKILDALVDGLTLTGSSDNLTPVVDELLAFRRAGVTEIGLRLYADPEAAIRLVAERIAPALK
ncbi:MAG: LLM class flavin-dependent oxidoreductase [Chromatiales bacterium]|nr:MAG: LLM class flavin-dependent oxidoreductase [Chromatiales bacterium]